MNGQQEQFDPRQYWEERARRFGDTPGGWKAVCYLGMPETYNRLLHRFQERVLRRRIRPSEVQNCFELACGVGRWLVELTSSAGKVWGGDLSFTMLREARKNLGGQRIGNAGLCQLDGKALPFAAGSFDIVFAVTVLIHIVRLPDLRRTVEELCRITRPGGRIIILESFASGETECPPHVRFRREGEVASFFRKLGWRLESSRPVFSWFPGSGWMKSRMTRVGFRLASPFYYAANVIASPLNKSPAGPAQKIQVYRYGEGRPTAFPGRRHPQ